MPHQIVQTDAATDLDRPRGLVQRSDVAEGRRDEGEPSAALRGIAVAPSQAPGDDTAGMVCNEALTQDASAGRLTRAVVGTVLPQPESR